MTPNLSYGGDPTTIMEWIILAYKIPPEPSRYRVAIWRSLKQMGSVYIQNSVCILPDLPRHREEFRNLGQRISQYGGEFMLFAAQGADEEEDQKVVSRFNEERDLEYKEVIEGLENFLGEIEMETKAQNFIFAELEENEGNLERLTTWMDKVKKRDFFGSSLGVEAGQKLAKCRDIFERFAATVYEFHVE